MTRQSIQAERKTAGLCVKCGGILEEGKTMCRPCLDRLSKEQKLLRTRRKAKRLCLRCAGPLLPEDPTHCHSCRSYRAVRYKRDRERWSLTQACYVCGKTAAPKKRRCQQCIDYERGYMRQRKVSGRCYSCGREPRTGSKRCQQCLDKRKQWNTRYRMEALTAYGLSCACCRESTVEFLEIDHINGNGSAHRRQLKTQSIYRWLKRNGYPEGFQTLCSNCNRARWRYGCCPHEKQALSHDTL